MINEKLEQKFIKFGEDELLGIKDENGVVWMATNKTMRDIGLSEDQCKKQGKKLNEDPLLLKYCKQMDLTTNGGIQHVYCIQINMLPIWLSSINRKTLNEIQYNKYIKLLNWSLSDNFDNYKAPTKIYSFESELRDELYSLGYFKNIKIIDKEVPYDFGRTDLEGIDENNNKCCIELKKYSETIYVQEQLLKYKNSNKFNRVIYCAYIVSDELKQWCCDNNIECCTYTRELIIQSNKNNDIYFGLLNNIEKENYGLEHFIEEENFYPTLREVQIYRDKLIKEFYKFKSKLLAYKQSNDIKNLYKMLIIIFYIKSCYIKAEAVDFNENFEINNIDEIVDLWSDSFKNYILGYGY